MKKYFPYLLKLLIAVIMLQTLFYKFTGAQESIRLFTILAGENEFLLRIGAGVLEFIAAILLFSSKYVWLGISLTISLMFCAILAHITKLGIAHNNDGGLLFISAVIAFLSAITLLYLNKKTNR